MVPFPNSASRPQSNPTLNHHSSPARRTLHRYVLEHSPQNYLSLLPRSARSMSDGDDHHDDFEPAKSDVSWAPQSSKLPLGRLPFAFPFSFFTNASQRALTLAPPPPTPKKLQPPPQHPQPAPSPAESPTTSTNASPVQKKPSTPT